MGRVFIAGMRALGVAFGAATLAGCDAGPTAVDSTPGSARSLPATGPRVGATAKETDAVGAFFELPLEALPTRETTFAVGGRNPFRFGLPAGGARSSPAGPAPASEAGVPEVPALVAALGAIPTVEGATAIRFIGLVEVSDRPEPVAVLADGDDVYHGRADDLVKGRYRLVAIAAASIEVEDVERGTRMTLGLNGVSPRGGGE